MARAIALFCAFLGIGSMALHPTSAQASTHAHNFSVGDSRSVQKLALESHSRFQTRLRDYESARFKDVTGRYVMVGGDRLYYICGDVQSKNAFGGYGDWMPFIVSESRIEPNIADLQFPGDSQSWPDDIFAFCGPDTGVSDAKFNYSPLLRNGASPQ